MVSHHTNALSAYLQPYEQIKQVEMDVHRSLNSYDVTANMSPELR